MQVLIVSTFESVSGSARAAKRLQDGFNEISVPSKMLVQSGAGGESNVVVAPQRGFRRISKHFGHGLDKIPLRLHPHANKSEFSTQWVPGNLHQEIAAIGSDIINLHWVNNSFFSIESMAKLKLPIVWTLHDMWAFTGGCHYSGECNRYQTNCGYCPQLDSDRSYDVSRWIWRRKFDAWKNLKLTLVSPSVWLANCARNSALFKNLRTEVIPNGINLSVYRPIDQKVARELLNLPQDKNLVLFGAVNARSNPRKGFHFLEAAMKKLNYTEWSSKVELVIFGTTSSLTKTEFGLRTHFLGKISDDLTMALVYSAADVFLAPSEHDNLPNTVMEAIACGKPCVAFRIGGMADMIDHYQNGYLADPYHPEELIQGLIWVLENEERRRKLELNAREKARAEYSQSTQARRYADLFEEILSLQ